MVVGRIWNGYRRLLQRRPLVTKACTSCCTMMTADAVCQEIEIARAEDMVNAHAKSSDKPLNLQNGCIRNTQYKIDDKAAPNSGQLAYNPSRTAQIGVVGLMYSGPISHTWYQILERVVKVKRPPLNVGLKLVFDAVIFAPVAIAGYFTLRSVLEGKSLEEIKVKLEKRWSEAVVASWHFWPVVNMLNFTFVALPYRVLFNNCFAFGWNGYLSHVNSAKLEMLVNERVTLEERGLSAEQIKEHLDKHGESHGCHCDHCRAYRT